MNIGLKGNGLVARLAQGIAAKLEGWGLLGRFIRVAYPHAHDHEHAPVRSYERGDERTIRRVAEMQNGGLSSEESAARYASGENPGGIHHRAIHREEGPIHMRPEYDPGSDYDEPRGHKERVPHGDKHLRELRKG